jgi:AcrR family transcriptional regulator
MKSQDNAVAERILSAGVRLFAEKGYATTSTREIAEAAGITKPMLYYYYGSKEGLCRAAMDQFLQELQARLESVAAMELDSEEELTEIISRIFEFACQRPDFGRLMITLAYGPEGATPGLDIEKFVDKIREHLDRAVEKACRAGLAPPGRVDAFAHALHGQVFAWCLEAVGPRKIQLTRALAGEIVTDLLNGFRPR